VSPGAADDAVLDLANRDNRLLVTNDKDFGELVFLNDRSTAGIVLVRVGAERTASKLAAIRRLLRTDLARLSGHFTVLGESRIRKRPLRREDA
jgi:predicted nuclease of predicted toxin-antitoxin system